MSPERCGADRRLCALGQLDDVAVEVPIPSGPSPRLRLRFMQHLGTRLGCTPVRFGQIVHLKRYLGSRRCRSVLRCVEREVHECAVGPRACSMATAGPAIVSAVIGNVKVESEALAVQGHRNGRGQTPQGRRRRGDSAHLAPAHDARSGAAGRGSSRTSGPVRGNDPRPLVGSTTAVVAQMTSARGDADCPPQRSAMYPERRRRCAREFDRSGIRARPARACPAHRRHRETPCQSFQPSRTSL